MPAVGMESDFYAILGVDRNAGPETIRRTYRKLMQSSRMHPDLGGDTEQAARINKAYSVLSNAELRSDYDARLLILERVAQGFEIDVPEPVVPPANACSFCGLPHNFSQLDDLSDTGCERCGSALQLVSSERMEQFGQRAVERFGRSIALLLYTRYPQSRAHAGQSEDMSLNGIRVRTRASLQPGQRVRLVSDAFDAVGEVVRSAVDFQGFRPRTTAGVSFLALRFKRPSGVFVSRQI